jgi:hypothetical protein
LEFSATMIVKNRTALFVYSTVCILWVISILVKLQFNGLILGFDYGLYHPDGALYATRALDWSGYSETGAANAVWDWYKAHAYKFSFSSPADLYYANHPLYPEYSTRILYPLLSIPFVKLLGVSGMLVIPALSLLVLMLIVTNIGLSLKKPEITLVILFLITSSSTVMRWMLSNTTDALLAGLFAIAGYMIAKKTYRVYWYFLFGLLILLSGITRISLLFWLVIAAMLWLQKSKAKAVYVAFLSLLIVYPTLLSHQSSSFLAVEGDKPFLEKLLLYPFYLMKITFFEFAQLFVLDRIFFILCIATIVVSIKNFRKDSSKYLLFIFLAGLLTGALNGNVGVNFRYQLPVLFFICWNLIDNLNFSLNLFKKLKNKTS